MGLVEVPLGRRAYQVVISEGLGPLGEAMRAAVGAVRVFLVTNPVVEGHWGTAARRSLTAAGLDPTTLMVPDGEAHKTLDTWRGLIEQMLDAGIERGDVVVALGGGVTGDIAGFAAASVLRGVRVVQVPTTLLAMVDSSVGGKTGVNACGAKNQVGAFLQPSLVFAPVECLQTLAEAEFRGGLGEVLKHGFIGDPALIDLCAHQHRAVLSRDPVVVSEVVLRCCRVKSAVVCQDELERGRRVWLNLGHTVGHAIESSLGLGGMHHGECVGVGMLTEARWAAKLGHAPSGPAEQIRESLERLGLPARVRPMPHDTLVAWLARDKKRARGSIRVPVLKKTGEVCTVRLLPHQFDGLIDQIPLLLED